MNAVEKRRVLVVDDDAQLAQLLCASVRLAGGEPVSVETLGAAMVELQRGEFALVLLDLHLPDALPQATIRSIPRMLDSGSQRVVVITGSPVLDALWAACTEAGATDVLGKNDRDFVEKVGAAMRGETCGTDDVSLRLLPEFAFRLEKKKPPEG